MNHWMKGFCGFFALVSCFLLYGCANLMGPPRREHPVFADDNTVGLWLFDETQYLHTTITDAGKYEYDLRLQKGGRLVAGKFGNALKVSAGPEQTVSYAGLIGSAAGDEMREKDGIPTGLWGPTEAPAKILKALAGGDWTCEFWLKLSPVGDGDGAIIDLGQAYNGGFSLNLKSAGKNFEIANAYAAAKAVCPTNLATGQWHHVAFTWNGSVVRHFVDGIEQAGVGVSSVRRQPLPDLQKAADREHESQGFSKDKDFEWRRRHRFNLAVGHDRQGNSRIDCMVDELRISDVVRYLGNFPPPASFSRNYGPSAPKPTVANGPRLLFGPDSPKGPVQLGRRKHLFIDDALIDSKQNVKLTCNPPTDRRNLNFGPEKSAWRATVVDVDGKVYMYIPDGYGSERGITRLMISEDGVSFTARKLGVAEFEGSTENNYVFVAEPFYGTFFKDLNPAISPREKYKLTAWVASRGIYLYMSGDGIRWRRNETCMLPLVSGGGAETYWDDQRGLYVDFIKRDSSFRTEDYPGGGRRACIFESREIYKTWPFKALETPYFEAWPVPAVTGEGPVIFAPNKNGQVYRTRAIKYPWAPDAYLAFVWRFDREDEHRQVDLGVSRDGIHWKFYADEAWYLTPGDTEEVLSLYGLVLRGDEIWQYFDYGGAHGRDKKRIYARLTQRLDGFVSVDAGGEAGTFTTKPLVFKGRKLTLNLDAKGAAKVAIVDQDQKPVSGFDLSDCDAVKGDSLRRTVTWKGSSNVGQLAGRVVRLKFQLQEAKLYALKFD